MGLRRAGFFDRGMKASSAQRGGAAGNGGEDRAESVESPGMKRPQLAFPPGWADIGSGRLAVDEPLANRVRSGRKQP